MSGSVFSLVFYVQLAAFRKAFPAVKDVSEKHPQDRETAVELIASVVVTLDCALVFRGTLIFRSALVFKVAPVFNLALLFKVTFVFKVEPVFKVAFLFKVTFVFKVISVVTVTFLIARACAY